MQHGATAHLLEGNVSVANKDQMVPKKSKFIVHQLHIKAYFCWNSLQFPDILEQQIVVNTFLHVLLYQYINA